MLIRSFQRMAKPAPSEHTVAADFRTVDREAVARATRKARNKRVVGVPKFVLPSKPDLRDEVDGTNLPIV